MTDRREIWKREREKTKRERLILEEIKDGFEFWIEIIIEERDKGRIREGKKWKVFREKDKKRDLN